MEKIGRFYIPIKRRAMVADTDFAGAGVVYYGSYMRWIEEAVTEYVDYKGASFHEIMDWGIYFTVRDVKMEYIKPVRYDELTSLGVRFSGIKGRRTVFNLSFFRDEETIFKAEIQYSSIDKDFQSSSPRFKEKMEELRGDR